MKEVTIARDATDPSTYEKFLCDDVRDLVMAQFSEWPDTARIYHGSVSVDCDVTPSDDAGIDRLGELPGPFFVVVYPGDPLTIILVAIAIIAAIAVTFLLMPKPPELRNEQQTSANNSLSQRTNEARILGRIEDIFGTVRAIPSMLSVPYTVYDNHKQLEICYMSIGRGSYDIDDIRDGDTLVANIAGASLAVFGPNKSPNNPLDVPEIQIGTAIGDPVFVVSRCSDVNGETLKAPNDRALTTSADLHFADGGIITSASGTIDFTDFFMVGDIVDVGGAKDGGGDPGDTAKQASATAHAHGFDFVSYDPTADFEAGKYISISTAVFQVDDGGTSGDISGGSDVPDYPNDPYCIEWDEPILLSNEAKDGPGETRAMRDCKAGDYVWTMHEATGIWGAYRISALRFVRRRVMLADDLPRATARHKFYIDGKWVRMNKIGERDGSATVGLITVDGAHTYVSVRPSGRQVVNHNRKQDFQSFA